MSYAGSQVEVYLRDILRQAKEQFLGRRAVGKQILSVTDSVAVGLTIPDASASALITIEEDATGASHDKTIRYWEDGSTPTASQGHPLGNLDVFEIDRKENLSSFKVIGVEAGKTHTLQITYYAQ